MAIDTSMPTPNPAPAPASSQALMDGISSLSAPGTTVAHDPDIPAVSGQQQPTAMGSQEMQQVSGFEQKAQAANERAAALANAPVISPDAPHAKLLSMVNALAVGLSAFGTSIATHGQEGGAKEVAQVLGEQQRQKLESQQSAMNQRNQQIQQQLMVADTNHKMGQNILLMATMPLDLEQKNLEVQKTQQGLQAGQQELEAGKVGLARQKFDLFANTGMSPDQIDKITSGGTVDAQTSSVLQANAQQQYRLASQILPADNPALTTLKKALDGNAPVGDVILASNRVKAELSGQENVITAQKNAAEAATAAKTAGTMDENLARTISTAPAGRYGADKVKQANDYIASINKQKTDAVVANAIATGKGTEGMYKNGVDPITHERLTLTNSPDEFMVDSRTGQPIPTGMLTTLKPTQQESNRADFAKSTLHTLDLIDGLRAQGKVPNGPVSGLTAKALSNAGLGGDHKGGHYKNPKTADEYGKHKQ